MKESLKGHILPESFEDHQVLEASQQLKFKCCMKCDSLFSPTNTHTTLGWRETQISGWCENCFDAAFKED